MTIAYLITGGLGDYGGGSGSCPTAVEIATAVLAAAAVTPIKSDVQKVNAIPVTGSGTAADPWNPA